MENPVVTFEARPAELHDKIRCAVSWISPTNEHVRIVVMVDATLEDYPWPPVDPELQKLGMDTLPLLSATIQNEAIMRAQELARKFSAEQLI